MVTNVWKKINGIYTWILEVENVYFDKKILKEFGKGSYLIKNKHEEKVFLVKEKSICRLPNKFYVQNIIGGYHQRPIFEGNYTNCRKFIEDRELDNYYITDTPIINYF